MLSIEEQLLVVAETKEPAALFAVLRELNDIKHPDDLDNAHLAGLDKQDIAVDALPDGFHVTGFLSTVTGAKFKKVLDAISAPTGADDDRTGAQRRVQGLDDLLSDVLASGMPSDKGVRPHLSVHADADTVAAAAEHVRQTMENPLRDPDPCLTPHPRTWRGSARSGPSC